MSWNVYEEILCTYITNRRFIMKNSSEISSNGSTSILAITSKEHGGKREEDIRAKDERAEDERAQSEDRFDLDTELSNLAIEIKTVEKSLRELARKRYELKCEKIKLDLVKEDAEAKLVALMSESDISGYDTWGFVQNYRVTLEESVYVDVTDVDSVPEKFKRYKSTVNKKLIQKLCRKGNKILRRTPRGTSFKKRAWVKISKYY